MNSKRTLLSVVCPAFNEALGLPIFHDALMKVLDGLRDEFDVEILYVDDGSLDNTLDVMRQFARSDSRVKYLSLSRNFGQQAALTAGMEHAIGDILISLDTDMQHPPHVIPRLLDAWRNGAQIVNTIRGEDKSLSWFKRWSSKLFYRWLRRLSQTEIRNAAADFRLMTRPAVLAFLRMRETHRFVRGMVQWLGFRCAEVHYEPRPRIAGTTSYTLRRLVGLALVGMLSFSKVPLRLPAVLGVILTFLGAFCSLWLVVGIIVGSLSNATLWVILAGMNLIGGATLLSLGIIGEYVGRIHDEVKGRPAYLLKETGNLVSDICEAVPQGVATAVGSERRAA